jgi:NAD(P)-dependent dehydrogenase (short-subunit alcohol dehydrogenase family)
LAREGAKVVVTDIDDAGAQAVVGKIVAAGGEAICLHQDVSIEEDWPRVIEATERRFGQLNVMMANAGIGILCKAIEMVGRLGRPLRDERRRAAVRQSRRHGVCGRRRRDPDQHRASRGH